ncbi:MAG TPA: GNAT family N-acetyltransferase [Candidatus Paceibacterota bacterium]|nr:GNAT family N-acetyltransferase [Candidatus Paceibacterota bacterium]
MNIGLVPATAANVGEYVRVMRAVSSRINLGITDPREALDHIEVVTSKKITADGELAGFVDYYPKGPDHVYIDQFAILPGFQGKGIGSFVLDTLLDQFKVSGMKKASLVTHPENEALRLYQRKGFVVIDSVDNFEGSGEPRLVLELVL